MEHIHVRVYPGKDDDLMEWVESLSPGERSQEIRDALRRGIGIPAQVKPHENIAAVVKQAVSEALHGMQLVADQQGIDLGTNEIEEKFGSQLDRLLGNF